MFVKVNPFAAVCCNHISKYVNVTFFLVSACKWAVFYTFYTFSSLSVSQLSSEVCSNNVSLQCNHRMKFAIVLPFKNLISIISRRPGAERIWNTMCVEMPLKRNLLFLDEVLICFLC